jgi:site-specific DNA-adenine methylase
VLVLGGDRVKSPFPWFGGKSKVAPLVWDRFGDVPNYCEPFFGSGAVLLGRPHGSGTETINDLDCMVANFWRALQHDPDAVAYHADNPVNEADQHARHLWLCSQEEFRERMKVEPEFYDTKIAGWWLWGQCIWIGSGWCSVQLPHLGNAGTGVHRKLPHLGNAGKGVNRQLPHLGNAGKGVNRQLPHLGNAGTLCVEESDPTSGTPHISRQMPSVINGGMGIHRKAEQDTPIYEYMRALAARLRRVRVCCGDWERILGPSVTFKHGITGVFLDPPYADTADRTSDLYASDSVDVAHKVREWGIANGENRDLRIALCGYEGEHEMPKSWDCVAWKANGGYGSQGESNENAARERIWFSPACLIPQPSLWSSV